MVKLPALSIQIREKHAVTSPVLDNKIIITWIQSSLVNLHLSFNQYILFITLRIGLFHYELLEVDVNPVLFK